MPGAHHGEEVVKAGDWGGRAGEFLAEGIAQVVCRVCGYYEDIPPHSCQLHCQAAWQTSMNTKA